MSKFHNLRSLAVHLLRQLRCFLIHYIILDVQNQSYIPTRGIHSTQKQLGQLEGLLKQNPELRRALETINNCQRAWPSLTSCQIQSKKSNILAHDGADISRLNVRTGGGSDPKTPVLAPKEGNPSDKMWASWVFACCLKGLSDSAFSIMLQPCVLTSW